jgi:amino acid transporter
VSSYPRAQWAALPLISLGYVLPVAAALAATSGWKDWTTGHWPAVARAVGGEWLAGLVMGGALMATAGLFLSLLLANSRLPFALARAGQLPAALARIHPRFGTPWAAVVLSSVCYSVGAFWSFKDLIVLDIWLYSLALLLELAAFAALRIREPLLPRPWRVAGGTAGMWLAVLLPSAVSLVAMATAGWTNTLAGVGAALTGPAAYLVWGDQARARRVLIREERPPGIEP